MTPSPSERKEILGLSARMLTDAILEKVDLEELATIELSTSAQLLGLSTTQAAKVLPVVEVGPRTRRVTVKDHKAFIAARRHDPKAPAAKTA